MAGIDEFLSLVSTALLTRDIDIGTVSVRLSVTFWSVFCRNGLTYHIQYMDVGQSF